MKKTTAFILIVSIVFSFAACGKNGEKDTTLYSSEVSTSQAQTSEISTQSASGNTTVSQTQSAVTTQPTTEKTTVVSTKKAEEKTTTEKETTPTPSLMQSAKPNGKILYGKRTGTNKTYTGLEPLKKTELPIVDPDNLRGLSTTEYNHSFGVSTGGEPHEISVNNQKFYKKYGGICLDTSGEKVIYLTFDCGYENGCTGDILDTLKEKNVPAAFFVTLDHVNSSPQIVARMINEGHIVGNHSTTHPNFSKISRTKMVEEIQTLDDCLRTKFGYSAPYFRFPEGACSENALELVQSIGYTSVFWSSAYADWDTSASKGKQYAFDTVTSRLHPGCVLLLHAVSYDNAAALGDIIDYARANGYTFKSLG